MDIDECAVKYRPGIYYQVIEDVSFTQFEGLAVIYDDGEKPTEKQLTAATTEKFTAFHWHQYGEFLGYDYLAIRARMIGYFRAVGWDRLDLENKEACARRFAVPAKYQLQIFAQDEFSQLAEEYNDSATACREKRHTEAVKTAWHYLEPQDMQWFAISLGVYVEKYIKYGIKGIGYNDAVEGVCNMIAATPRTQFEKTGLAAQDFTPKYRKALAEVVAILNNIVVNGVKA